MKETAPRFRNNNINNKQASGFYFCGRIMFILAVGTFFGISLLFFSKVLLQNKNQYKNPIFPKK